MLSTWERSALRNNMGGATNTPSQTIGRIFFSSLERVHAAEQFRETSPIY